MIKHLLKKALGIYELERKINNQKDELNILNNHITSLKCSIQSTIADTFKLEKLSDLQIYEKYKYTRVEDLTQAAQEYLFDRYNLRASSYFTCHISGGLAISKEDTIGKIFEKYNIIRDFPVPYELTRNSESTVEPAKPTKQKTAKKSTRKAKAK